MMSAVIAGVAAIRPIVRLFGRFTPRGISSRQRLQNQLRYGAQRIEHAIAVDGDGLEVRGAFDPFAGRHLLDEILPRVIRIGRDALPAWNRSTSQPGFSAACSSAIGAALGKSRLLYWMTNGIFVRS